MSVSTLRPLAEHELATALERERDRLRWSVRSLAEAVRALSESQGEESGPGGDAGDVASDLAEEAVDLALEYAERDRLDEVEAALRRLEAGTYGRCEACGTPVGRERLYALPWTRYCIGCAAGSAS
jgi:DnaK suppressor protein